LELLPVEAREHLRLPVFSWHDTMPARIGAAMHAAIEGDPEGGGLLGQVGVDQLRAVLCRQGDLPEGLRPWVERFAGCPSDDDQPPMPAGLVPGHLRQKLLEGGQFRIEEGTLLDRRGRPLTPSRLMKLVRMMVKSFGRFFLCFQNTHPLLGVVLAPSGGKPEELAAAWLQAGRVTAGMTLRARAAGLVSIIKSGPVEFARAALGALVSELAEEPEIRETCRRGDRVPLLTFQLGGPLGPEELVSAGQPDQHTGLAERLLDRRAPRAPLATHYIPAP